MPPQSWLPLSLFGLPPCRGQGKKYGIKFARDIPDSRRVGSHITPEHSVAQFVDRLIRAAKLEARLYEEVESDPSAMGQALGVVLLASLAAGIGDVTQGGLSGVIVGTVAALLG